MSVYALIERLQSGEKSYIGEQMRLDTDLCSKVKDALDWIADPTTIPVSVCEVGSEADKVEFDFGHFTASVTDHHDNKDTQVLKITFEPGVVVREGTKTLSRLQQEIHKHLELDTRYGGPHRLNVGLVGPRLRITVEVESEHVALK